MKNLCRLLLAVSLVAGLAFGASAKKNNDKTISLTNKACNATDAWAKTASKSMTIVIHEPAADGNDEYEYKETVTIHYDYAKDGTTPYPRLISIDRNNHGSYYTEAYYYDPAGSHRLICAKVSYVEYGNPPASESVYYFVDDEIIDYKNEWGFALSLADAKARAAKMRALFNALASQMR